MHLCVDEPAHILMGPHRKPVSVKSIRAGHLGDSHRARCIKSLLEVDSTSPVNDARRTAEALLAIYGHVLSDVAVTAAENGDFFYMCSDLLAAYIALREGLEESDYFGRLADAANPNVTENATLREVVTRLRLHSVKKTAEADPFFARLESLVGSWQSALGVTHILGSAFEGELLNSVRQIVVKSLLVLSVRSEPLLEIFEREDVPVDTPACLPILYQQILALDAVPFPCMVDSNSDWSMGMLVDSILYPFWANPAHFDRLILNPLDLKPQGDHPGYALFRQGLVFSHTFEYLTLLMCDVSKDMLEYDDIVVSSKNGAAFLHVANCTSQKGVPPRSYTWRSVRRRLSSLLPENLGLCALNAQSSACKMIQCWQAIFSGLLLGGQRNVASLVEGHRVKKPKKKRPGPRVERQAVQVKKRVAKESERQAEQAKRRKAEPPRLPCPTCEAWARGESRGSPDGRPHRACGGGGRGCV